MGTSLPSCIWDSTAPTPTSLASVVTVVGAVGSKRKTRRSSASASCRVLNAVFLLLPPGERLSFPGQPSQRLRQGGHVREKVKVKIDHTQKSLHFLDIPGWGAVEQGLDIPGVGLDSLGADDVSQEVHLPNPKAALVRGQPEVRCLAASPIPSLRHWSCSSWVLPYTMMSSM